MLFKKNLYDLRFEKHELLLKRIYILIYLEL